MYERPEVRDGQYDNERALHEELLGAEREEAALMAELDALVAAGRPDPDALERTVTRIEAAKERTVVLFRRWIDALRAL